jgi:hypothetical protein
MALGKAIEMLRRRFPVPYSSEETRMERQRSFEKKPGRLDAENIFRIRL